MNSWFNIFKLSLRVQEQCFTEMNLVCRITPDDKFLHPGSLPFLASLKLASPTFYEALSNKSLTPTELIASLPNSLAAKQYLDDHVGGMFEAILYKYLCSEEQINQKMNSYRELESKKFISEGPQITKERIAGFLGYLQYEKRSLRHSSELKTLFNKFSIVDQISIT